jgi:hypothetical protein
MTIVYEERPSDSPYVETVTYGHTVNSGSTIRPAEIRWHMVFTRHEGQIHPLLVGPLTMAGSVSWGEGAEILWIRFKLGTFIPHLPTRNLLDMETLLPDASSNAFWLKGSAWQFPDYENVDTFIDRLVRDEIIVSDPVVTAALEDEQPDIASRTLRHRFLRATGLSQNYVRQFERAQYAVSLLHQGVSILDTVYEAGYFDQPHLTRALKQFVGYTPAQIVAMSAAASQAIQDPGLVMDDHAHVLTEISE